MKHLKYLMAVLIVCIVMMIGTKSASAAQTQTMTLDGEAVYGSTYTSICFEIEPKSSGTVKFRLIYASNDGVKAVLKNVSTGVEKELTYINEDSKTVLEINFYAEPTKYQIMVDFVNGSRNLNYKALAKLVRLDSEEGKKGDSFEQAILMEPDDQKRGIVAYGDNSDYYKIVLNSEGTLKIHFRNHSEEAINIKLYDTYKNLIQLETVSSTSREFVIGKANGIYYLQIDRVYSNGIGTNYTLTTGDYIPITKLQFSKSSLTLTTGDVKTLKTNVTPTNATENYTYKSSNKSIVTVYSSGKIKAVKAGTATISVTSVNGKVVAKCKVTVKAKEVKKLSLNKTSATLTVKDNLQLETTITPSDVSAKLTYSSSNQAVATVTGEGMVTAVRAGTCTITVTSKNGVKATCQITVKSAPKSNATPKSKATPTPVPEVEVTSIKADTNLYFMKPGETKTIVYTISPSNATNQKVSFSSLDTSIATVDAKGMITAVATGKTIINGQTENGKIVYITLIIE